MHALVLVVDRFPLGLAGCYGNDWVETPAIDRLADEGFVFDHYCAESPAVGGTLYATMHGWPLWRRASPKPASSLISAFRSREIEIGYLTDGAVDDDAKVGWDCWEALKSPSPPDAELPPVELLASHPEYRPPSPGDPRYAPWMQRWRRQLARELLSDQPAPRTIEQVFESARRWVESRGRRPSLQWVDLALFSSDWIPPEAFHRKYFDTHESLPIRDPAPGMVGEMIRADELPLLRATAAGRLSYFDSLLGGLLDALKGNDEEILFVLTADAGLPMGEHGMIGPHRPWLYEEQEHVPLLMRLPTGRRCTRSPALATSSDLHATLREYFGAPVGPEGESRSLLPFLLGKPAPAHDFVVAGLNDAEFAIRTRQWKLLLPTAREDSGPPRPRGLFAKPEDRWDHHNLAELHAEAADYLELQLRRYIDASRRGTIEFLAPLREDALTLAR